MSFRQEMRDFVHGFQATASVAQKINDNRTKPWPWENDPAPLEPGTQTIPKVDTGGKREGERGGRPAYAEDDTPVPEPRPGPDDTDPVVADDGAIPEPQVDPATTSSIQTGGNDVLVGSGGSDALAGSAGSDTIGGPGFGQTAYKYYRSIGKSHAEAVGWAANAMQESGGDPNVFSGKRMGDNGASGYLYQWQDNPGGKRLSNLREFARSRGHAQPTLKDQFDFPLEEGNPDSPFKDDIWANKYKDLANIDDPKEAVAHIRQWFERPGKDDLNSRLNYASKIDDTGDYSVSLGDDGAASTGDETGDDSILKLGGSGVIDTSSDIQAPAEEPAAAGAQPAEMIPIDMVDLSLGVVPQVEWQPAQYATGGVVNKANPSANKAGVDPYNPNRSYTQKVGGTPATSAGTPARATFTPRRIGDPGGYTAPTGPTPSQLAWKKAQAEVPKPVAPAPVAPAPAPQQNLGFLDTHRIEERMRGSNGYVHPRDKQAFHNLLQMRSKGATQEQFVAAARNLGVWRDVGPDGTSHSSVYSMVHGYAEGGMIPENEDEDEIDFAGGGKVDRRPLRESWHAGAEVPGVHLIDPGTRDQYSAAHDRTLFTKPRAGKAAPGKAGGKKEVKSSQPDTKATIKNPIVEEMSDRDKKRPDRKPEDIPVIEDRETRERRPEWVKPAASDAEVVPQVNSSDGTVADSRAVEVRQGASPSMAEKVTPGPAESAQAPAPSGAGTVPPEQAATATPVIPDTLLPRTAMSVFPEVQPSTGRFVQPEPGRAATQIAANKPEPVIPESPDASVQPAPSGAATVTGELRPGDHAAILDEAVGRLDSGEDPKAIGQWLLRQGIEQPLWPVELQNAFVGFARGGQVRQSWHGGEVPGVETVDPGTEPSKAYRAPAEQADEEDKPDMEPTRELMDGVAKAADMGLKYLGQHFAGGGDGAIPEANNQNAAVRFAQGEGAATREEIDGVDSKVDPRRELREGDRQMARLHQMTNWYMVNGKPKEAAASAASLLQYGATRFGRLGTAAATAYQAYQQDGDSKNLDNAVRYLEQAYQMIPDGATMNIAVDPNRGFVATRTKPDGSKEYIDITPEQLPGLITGVVDKSLYWNQLAQLADPAGYRQQQGWKHARKEKLDERAYQEGREEEQRGYTEGREAEKLGESRSYTERVAAAKAKADAAAKAAEHTQTREEKAADTADTRKYTEETEAARNKREAEEAAGIKEADAKRKRTDYEKVQPLVAKLEQIKATPNEDEQIQRTLVDNAASRLFDALPPDVDRWERMADMGFPADEWDYVSPSGAPADPADPAAPADPATPADPAAAAPPDDPAAGGNYGPKKKAADGKWYRLNLDTGIYEVFE